MPRAQPETTQETIDRLRRHIPAMSPEDRERADRTAEAIETNQPYKYKREE